MAQAARNLSGFDGALVKARYLIHERDAKYTAPFDAILQSSGIDIIKVPPRSPNLNAFAERFVLSIKTECLGNLILFGERSLRKAVSEYIAHYHHERPHQSLDNRIPFPLKEPAKAPQSKAKLKTAFVYSCNAFICTCFCRIAKNFIFRHVFTFPAFFMDKSG